MLSIRAAYTPAFHGITRSQLRTRADVGAAHSEGDTRTDSNGEVWTYELGTELPGGKIRAHTDGYGGFTTGWYSLDFFSRESGVDAFIDAYAVANAGASKAAKATTSSGGGGKKTSGGGGVTVKPKTSPDSVAGEIASDNSWLIAIGAGVAVFLTVLIFKAPV